MLYACNAADEAKFVFELLSVATPAAIETAIFPVEPDSGVTTSV